MRATCYDPAASYPEGSPQQVIQSFMAKFGTDPLGTHDVPERTQHINLLVRAPPLPGPLASLTRARQARRLGLTELPMAVHFKDTQDFIRHEGSTSFRVNPALAHSLRAGDQI